MKQIILTIPVLLMGWVLTACDSSSGDASGSSRNVYDVNSYPMSTLTEGMKYSLAYMWHEEKVAKDIYLALNGVHANAKMKQIADNGEATHISMVQSLVEKYDLNVTNLETGHEYEVAYTQEDLDALAPGEFAIAELQTLYDTLYSEGTVSAEAALKVGCKVEVTDINDLTLYIYHAAGAEDLEDIFDYLRSGSYKHYWAFDGELKTLGVSEGCCSLGSEYCHNEYPQN